MHNARPRSRYYYLYSNHGAMCKLDKSSWTLVLYILIVQMPPEIKPIRNSLRIHEVFATRIYSIFHLLKESPTKTIFFMTKYKGQTVCVQLYESYGNILIHGKRTVPVFPSGAALLWSRVYAGNVSSIFYHQVSLSHRHFSNLSTK